ncbi:Transmembrane protein [Biomphalaria glabrata]|nr:Transmembrane protein [Biomphalaria glabrata]
MTVILRQYERYIDRDLSSLTNESMQAASSAPAHNIWAERTLGLFDAMARRAPNAKITYLDGKAKAKVNKSLNWLYSKSITEQDNIVKFSIARANTLRSLAKNRRLRAEEIITLRLRENGQRRDMADRNKLGKEMKPLIETSIPELVMTNPIFLHCPRTQRRKSVFS